MHVISTLNVGGAEAMLVDLVDRLRDHNFDQHVIYFYDGPHVERLKELHIPTYHIKGFFTLYDPVFFMRFVMLLRKLKPDCLHTLLWAANFAGRLCSWLLGTPHVQALHNNIDQNGTLRIKLDSATISSKNMFVAVSKEVKQSFLNCISLQKAPTIKVITNGIDFSAVCNQEKEFRKKREDIGLSKDHFVIGSVGRFVPLKNYPLLLDQFCVLIHSHPQVRLVLMGVGPQEEYLKQKIKKLGLCSYVTILVNKKAVYYYHLFDCFVLPSFKEGVSIALLEAMSFSLPCVVGNHIKDHAVIKSGVNGIVVTPDQSFNEVFERLIVCQDEQKKLAEASFSTVKQNFSIDNMVYSYSKLFADLHNRI